MKIQRLLLPIAINLIQPGKVLVVYGPRQVGKTTLLNQILNRKVKEGSYRLVNGDELPTQTGLSSQDSRRLNEFLQGAGLLAVDEAQKIKNIGINLKILVDNHPDVSFIATGSASLDLASKITEPLTGRKHIAWLYPVSYQELIALHGPFEAKNQLDRWLIWGGYPEVVLADNPLERERRLYEITGSYLYKDILELEGIKYPKKIADLLRLLAFQIGSEVAMSELAANLSLDRKTVERYLDLLEQSFVIFNVGGFSRNLRKEIAKTSRYYFFDNGIRNALIENFNPLHLRNDVGQLWENFLTIERRKKLHYSGRRANTFFWRTYDRQEIDSIEEYGGGLHGHEFTWSTRKRKKVPPSWSKAYPEATYQIITPENFTKFIT